jgi:hypothetical protein
MAEIARKTKRHPSDLTDEEWERIRPLLPKLPRSGRRPVWLCCRDQVYGRIGPNPRLGSIDADIDWIPQRQHVVEGTDRHRHLGRPTFVYTRAQPVADHSFPSCDGRLEFGDAAQFGNLLELTVALCRISFSGFARHSGCARRYGHRGIGTTFGNGGVNAILIISTGASDRGHRICGLFEQGTNLGGTVKPVFYSSEV